MTRSEGLSLLLNMDSGTAWVESPATKYNKVFAAMVEPTDPSALGIMDADGEEIAPVRTSIEIYRSLVRMFAKAHSVEP